MPTPSQELTNSLQAEEDKANRLSKTKIKLESAVHEAHDEFEKEKSHRAEVEKAKRKIEGELKVNNNNNCRENMYIHVTAVLLSKACMV
jgi:hypothetical protein